MVDRWRPSKQFYAYVHAKPKTVNVKGIFYIGKGHGKRAYQLHRKENIHHQRVVNKYGRQNILVSKLPCSSEATAFDLEIGLIRCLRRMGVKLINQTEGGNQPPVPTWNKENNPEWCAKMLAAIRSPEVSKKKSISGRAVRASTEARQFMSEYGKASWVDNSERRQQTSDRFKSRITITDGIRERRILLTEIIPMDWRRGRSDAMLVKMSLNAFKQQDSEEARQAFVKRIRDAKERRDKNSGQSC
jgi:hypothetical protein